MTYDVARRPTRPTERVVCQREEQLTQPTQATSAKSVKSTSLPIANQLARPPPRPTQANQGHPAQLVFLASRSHFTCTLTHSPDIVHLSGLALPRLAQRSAAATTRKLSPLSNH